MLTGKILTGRRDKYQLNSCMIFSKKLKLMPFLATAVIKYSDW